MGEGTEIIDRDGADLQVWQAVSRERFQVYVAEHAGGPYFGFVNGLVYFDGSGSNDTDGNITKWFWEFGDDTNDTGEVVSHKYLSIGAYNLTLTVTDNRNATGVNKTIVTIVQPNRPPSKPTIQGPSTGAKLISYGYSFLSTDEDGDLLKYSVNFANN